MDNTIIQTAIGVLDVVGLSEETSQLILYSLILIFIVSYAAVEVFFARYESKHEVTWREARWIPKILLCIICGSLIFISLFLIYKVLTVFFSFQETEVTTLVLFVVTGMVFYHIIRLSFGRDVVLRKTTTSFLGVFSKVVYFFGISFLIVGGLLFWKLKQKGNFILVLIALLMFYSDSKMFEKHKQYLLTMKIYLYFARKVIKAYKVIKRFYTRIRRLVN